MTDSLHRDILLDAGLPSRLLDVWRSGHRSPLHVSFAPPNHEVAESLRNELPYLKAFVPIFEQNGEAVIGLLPEGLRFIRFYYEDGLDGPEAVEVMGLGYQQFAASILLEYEEAALSHYYNELSDLLAFDSISVLRQLLDTDPYDDNAVEAFHDSLADQSPQ